MILDKILGMIWKPSYTRLLAPGVMSVGLLPEIPGMRGLESKELVLWIDAWKLRFLKEE